MNSIYVGVTLRIRECKRGQLYRKNFISGEVFYKENSNRELGLNNEHSKRLCFECDKKCTSKSKEGEADKYNASMRFFRKGGKRFVLNQHSKIKYKWLSMCLVMRFYWNGLELHLVREVRSNSVMCLVRKVCIGEMREWCMDAWRSHTLFLLSQA